MIERVAKAMSEEDQLGATADGPGGHRQGWRAYMPMARAAIEIAAAEIQRIHREAEAKYPHCPGDSDCSDLEEFSVRVREHFGLVEAAAKG